MKSFSLVLPLLLSVSFLLYAIDEEKAEVEKTWQIISDSKGEPQARHEAEYVRVGEKFYLVGGRGWRRLDIYDPVSNSWSVGKKPPVEIHHFQGLEFQGELWIAGGFIGKYPKETPYETILIYNPKKDEWREGAKIERPRGGGGFVEHAGKLYLVCGITNGHVDGHVAWVDCLDPQTGKWTQLADAPRARDHFRAVVIDGKIYNAAGRRTAKNSAEGVFGNTVAEVDFYDISGNSWKTLPEKSHLPVPRAGNAAIAYQGQVMIVGGESPKHKTARSNVDVLDLQSETWKPFPSLERGRHGSGVIEWKGSLFIASGCGNRGGAPELKSQERYDPAE